MNSHSPPELLVQIPILACHKGKTTLISELASEGAKRERCWKIWNVQTIAGAVDGDRLATVGFGAVPCPYDLLLETHFRRSAIVFGNRDFGCCWFSRSSVLGLWNQRDDGRPGFRFGSAAGLVDWSETRYFLYRALIETMISTNHGP